MYASCTLMRTEPGWVMAESMEAVFLRGREGREEVGESEVGSQWTGPRVRGGGEGACSGTARGVDIAPGGGVETATEEAGRGGIAQRRKLRDLG